MKKYIVLFICLLCLPCMVNAKEYCSVVSGNGSTLGSEIKCGTEHFYVMESKNNKISLLAKYNLMVGDIIDYFDVEGITYEDGNYFSLGEEECGRLASQKGYNMNNVYLLYPIFVQAEYPYRLTGCRVYERIVTDHVRQDEKAIGTKLDGTGHSILPIYGITYMNPDWGYREANENYQNVYDNNGDLVLEGSSFKKYMDGYKSELQSQNIEVDSVSFPTLNKVISFFETIIGKDIDVNLIYPDAVGNTYDDTIGKMDINEYVDNKNKWIYGTTYWLGSGFMGNTSEHPNVGYEYNDYYITNEGMLCALGRGICSYLAYPIGNGVRPLITISSGNLHYLIRTETDGHGTIEVVDNAAGGDQIRFKVNAHKGYKLSGLVVIADSGETVEFTEGEIVNNSDGTVSIDKNRFTMPFDNVTIQAKWKMDLLNPNTSRSLILIVIVIMISLLSFTIVKKRKKINVEEAN